MILAPQSSILEATVHISHFFPGAPQNDHRLCTPHPLKCFSQINNLGDSVLSFKDLSRCWCFRIIVTRSWFHFLLNLLFGSGTLKCFFLYLFLKYCKLGLLSFAPGISDKRTWHCTLSLKNSIEWVSLWFVHSFHAGSTSNIVTFTSTSYFNKTKLIIILHPPPANSWNWTKFW